jgi:hypothetical protein
MVSTGKPSYIPKLKIPYHPEDYNISKLVKTHRHSTHGARIHQ